MLLAQNNNIVDNNDNDDSTDVVFVVFCGDILSKLLTYLPLLEIVSSRQVSKAWKDAVENTCVEEELLIVNNNQRRRYLSGIAKFLPKLQRIHIEKTPDLDITQDEIIRIISGGSGGNDDDSSDDDDNDSLRSFHNLKYFTCCHCTNLRFCLSPVLLQGANNNNLQNLTHLNLHGNEGMEWKLVDLLHLQKLISLRCINNLCLQGELQDLAMQHPNSMNFVTIDISGCILVTGNLLDFRYLPKLQLMALSRTKVTGDLRDVEPDDFKSLQLSGLNESIYGSSELDCVADATVIMKTRHRWIQQSNDQTPIWPFRVSLSRSSSEYHERIEQRLYSSEKDPPFNIESVQVGNRWGWRWSNYLGGVCQVHWLDIIPNLDSVDYQIYIKESDLLRQEEEKSLFGNFLDPPTPVEYERLCLLEQEEQYTTLRDGTTSRGGGGEEAEEPEPSTILQPQIDEDTISGMAWNLHEEVTVPDLY